MRFAVPPIRRFAHSSPSSWILAPELITDTLITDYWCLGCPGADLSQGFYEFRDDSRLKSVFLPDSPKRHFNRFGRHQISENNLAGGKLFDRVADKCDAKASGCKGQSGPYPVRLPRNAWGKCGSVADGLQPIAVRGVHPI